MSTLREQKLSSHVSSHVEDIWKTRSKNGEVGE